MKTWQRIKADPKLVEKYLVREKVVDTIRAFFKEQGFHEVSTPVLVPVPSAESNLEVFETQLRTSQGISRRAFLIMSPEYALKKLVTAGLGSVFEITKCFRNDEEISRLHNPEFTMIEWYRVGADYTAIMADFENLFVKIIKDTTPNTDLSRWIYQNEEYDLTLPWQKMSVAQAFKKFADIQAETLLSKDKLLKAGKGKGYQVGSKTTWEQIFYQIFFNEIETKIRNSHKPMIIFDYPLSQAALAKKKADDPRFAERFEVFLAGIELGNCFSELTNPTEQEARFRDDLTIRKRLGKTDYPIDADFIEALKTGMPQVAGIAVGIDRLVMLAANVPTVADTLFFPAAELFDLKPSD